MRMRIRTLSDCTKGFLFRIKVSKIGQGYLYISKVWRQQATILHHAVALTFASNAIVFKFHADGTAALEATQRVEAAVRAWSQSSTFIVI